MMSILEANINLVLCTRLILYSWINPLAAELFYTLQRAQSLFFTNLHLARTFFSMFIVWHRLFSLVLIYHRLRIEALPLSTVQGK